MNILAIDQGTTSSRAILFDRDGSVISVAQHPIKQYYPKAGWVEHDATEILESVIRAVRDCLYGFEGKVDFIGITNQRETAIVWDKKTGKPVSKAIVWQCRRTADICESLKRDGYEDYIKRTTGLPIDAYFSGTKIKWMLDNVEGLRERAERGEVLFGTVDSFLVYSLTGNHLTDVTNASRTMLFDINSLSWDDKLCEILSVPKAMLPRVCESSDFFGRVRTSDDIPSRIWNVPIYSVLGDQHAALFGQTCYEVGMVKNTYGTGCFTLMNIGENAIFDKELITTVAWKSGGRTVYALEGSVFNAGSSVQWLRDELGIIKTAAESSELAASVKSTNGVYFVSAFTGLGAPYWDMYARGALVGITRGTGRAHICRAVLEGIAYQVSDLIETMEKGASCRVKALYVDGGASASDFMMQFQADLLGISVDRPCVTESTALGAAFMAGVGAGVFRIEELAKTRKSERIFTPCVSDIEREEWKDGWKRAVSSVIAGEKR